LYESYGLRDATSGASHGFIRKNPGEMCEHHGKPIRRPACSSMKAMFVGRFYLADLEGLNMKLVRIGPWANLSQNKFEKT